MFTHENGLLVRFFQDAVQDEIASDSAGRPIFHDRDFVQIMVPGDPKNQVTRVAEKTDKARFVKTWTAYQAGRELSESGTPIEQWPLLSKAQALELKGAGIATVEIFADVSDANLQKLGPGYKRLQVKAKDYLASADKDAAAQAWTKERDALYERIAQLEMVIEAQQADAPRKGRPRKQTVED